LPSWPAPAPKHECPARKRKRPPRTIPGGPCAWGLLYYTTWYAEGSRTRRTVSYVGPGGTATGGVVPGHRARRTTLSGSGAETALPVRHDGPSARAAQRRPGAKHPS
jgi:hypothetical protein